MDLTDEVIERPHGFKVGRKQFYLYPPTLGKLYLQARLIESLQISQDNLKTNSYLETLRLVHDKRETCCRIIAYNTCKTKDEVYNNILVERRISLFMKESDEDLATLMVMVVSSDKLPIYMKELGIDKEREKINQVMRIRDESNTLSFGGLTIYGSLIGAACEKYHWTFQYVVWGISYTNLRLLMSDAITSITLSDKERKRIHFSTEPESKKVNGNDKAAMEEFIKTHNFK